MKASASSRRSRASASDATPACRYCAGKGPPRATPNSMRPPLSRSSAAMSSATRTGSFSGSSAAPVPRRMRRVRAASWASSTMSALQMAKRLW